MPAPCSPCTTTCCTSEIMCMWSGLAVQPGPPDEPIPPCLPLPPVPRRFCNDARPQNLRNQIQNGRTTISVVISPETPATDIAALLEDIAPGAGIACSPVRALRSPSPRTRASAVRILLM